MDLSESRTYVRLRKLSNMLFERKREILSTSELKLNEALTNTTQWGVREIEQRGSALADAANALWSAPIPGIVTPHYGFGWTRRPGGQRPAGRQLDLLW